MRLPFTNRKTDPVAEPSVPASGPTRSYAAPSLASGSAYVHPGEAYASAPTIDPRRNRIVPSVDFRPDPLRPSQEFYEGRNGREVNARHGVEDQDADGYTALMQRKGAAPDPRLVPPAEPRPTSRMSPRTYTFMRPWDRSSARMLNGMHFSMAEHRRTYPVLGMQPVRTARNTFRIPPAPWDTDIVDMPADASPAYNGRIVAVDIPPAGNRSGRLS